MNNESGPAAAAAHPAVATSILHAARVIEERTEAALATAGLSMAKQSALAKLVEAGEPLTLSDLAARLSCVRSNMTQLIDRLEADGLVRRVDDPSDRRVVRAELTPLGRRRQAEGERLWREAEVDVLRGLGEREAEALVGLLRTVG